MPKLIVLIAALIVSTSCCQAKDAFESVRCGGDIPKALIGKVVRNERVVVTEKRHQELGLKDEGSEEISDSLSYAGWTICGNSYHLLENRETIRDVLLVDHSRSHPAFLGSCEKDGRPMPDPVFGILDASVPADTTRHFAPDDTTLAPAVSAWRIDEAQGKFVKIDTEKLKCPRNAIFSVDGGP
jgi:hypothetical protein